ncbi:hypothetical protein ACIHJG_38025 [Streptomyces sp. NPDC052415]|uniref:hypothetical protein n=1 Tax=Streptomyces sp. NPDC052415 TaxID=3365690 RepID=UPI0037D3C039
MLGLAAAQPELLLTGQALIDQGQVATVMLQAGWSSEHLRHVIAGRPLPRPVRTSVGAVIAARLKAAQAHPPPSLAAHHPDPPSPNAVWGSTSCAARTVREALTYRALAECTGCGHPTTAPGENLCPACLDWPPCRTCPGRTPRRARPDGDGRCTTCTGAAAPATRLEGSSP